MNAIENEVLDLANNIKDTIARGIKSHDERVETSKRDLEIIQKGEEDATSQQGQNTLQART